MDDRSGGAGRMPRGGDGDQPRPHDDRRWAVIGADADGPVRLDVRGHVWCGGAAGSGKTALARRVAFGLAARYTPDEVRFLALDGSDGLEAVAALPHTAQYASLPRPFDARRATRLLDGFVRGREVLERVGGLDEATPLVVFVDGAGPLASADPDFAAVLRRLVDRGDLLRMALIATFRGDAGPDAVLGGGGVRNRIALADPAAAETPRPGEGLLSIGSGGPRRLTIAAASAAEVREAPRGRAAAAADRAERTVLDRESRIAYRRPEGWWRKGGFELAELAAIYRRAYTSHLTCLDVNAVASVKAGPLRHFVDGDAGGDLEAAVRAAAVRTSGIMMADHELESRTLVIDGCEAATATVHAYVRLEIGVPPPRWWWVRTTAVRIGGEVTVLDAMVRAEGDTRGLEGDFTAVVDGVHDSIAVLG